MSSPTTEQTETSRRALRQLLNRRDFVATTGGIVATVAGLSLGGCSPAVDSGTGGSTGGGIPSGARSISGTATLPAGSQLKLSEMSVDILTQTVPVSSTGAFTVGISPGSPSLGLLLDASGDGVLMAVFDPASNDHAITTRTTAVAMLFYATSAHSFPTAVMSQILALLSADPAIAALDAVVAAAVVADPQALANNASGLGPAVTTALTTILGAAGSVRKPAAAARLEDPVPTLMLLTPSGEQDGVQVSQQDGSTPSLLISNSKRRPCIVYIYETTTLTGNVTTDVSPAKLILGPITLDSTESLSLFNSLKDFTTFFHGTSPWSPVNLPPIPIALESGTDRTSYQVIVLASALKAVSGDAFEPPFFRDPHFANEVSKWRTADANLLYTSIFGDILLPIFCFFGGFGAITAARSTIASLVTDAAAAGSATFTRIISQLEYGSLGDMTEALANVVRDAIRSDTSTQFWKPQIQAVIGQAEAKALEAQTLAGTATRLTKGSKMFLSVFEPIFAAGVILDGFDLGAIILDVFNSDIGATWTALLIRQTLNLAPVNPHVSSGERVVFTVANPANTPGADIEYDWFQTSVFSTLSAENEANVGQQITTTQRIVDLITTPSDVNPITVTVIGYDKSSGSRVEIGRASTAVSFLLRAEITPSGPTPNVNDQVLFSVAVDGPPPGVLQYKWTLTGSAGTIGATNVVTTTVPQVSYIAHQLGTDQLHVDVLSGTTLVAKADVTVPVLAPAHITPASVALGIGDHQTFTVGVDGTVPANAQYKWTLNGTAGNIGAGTVIVTTVPQISYTAVQLGNDTLHVDVLNGTSVIAKADAAVAVGAAPSIQFVIAGAWPQDLMPPDGGYSFMSFIGARGTQPSPGVDIIAQGYDVDPLDNEKIGVELSLIVATGTNLSAGQVFTKVVLGILPSANQFQVVLSQDLGRPDNTFKSPPVGGGTVVIQSVVQLSDGTYVFQYTLSLSNGTGGTIIGSGVGRWK
ncbi:MAG TPA: hypothetical protein VGM77_05915 [Gemmatimonadales bacterium]|jgi:hypothetical protein